MMHHCLDSTIMLQTGLCCTVS